MEDLPLKNQQSATSYHPLEPSADTAPPRRKITKPVLFWIVIIVAAVIAGIAAGIYYAVRPDDSASTSEYSRCRLSVVGAGWGGVYLAWRLTLSDEAIYDVADLCIFERSTTRVGGRAYSYTNPSMEDLHTDLGAYRYQTGQELVKGVHESILNLTVHCYNGYCDSTTGYRVVSDPYGNNAGYNHGIYGLLDLLNAKYGSRIFMGHELVNVHSNRDSDPNRPIRLIFGNGVEVVSERVHLNLPDSAILHLVNDSKNLLFNQVSNFTAAALRSPQESPAIKQYVWYDDAWWLTKLNKTTGGIDYENPDSSVNLPPIYDCRYGDGPVKCYTELGNGTRQYFSTPQPGGTCYGALLSAYTDDDAHWAYFRAWATDADQSKDTSVWITRGDPREELLDLTHQAQMEAHNASLWAAGIDPATIAPPWATVMGIWGTSYIYGYPSYHGLWDETIQKSTNDAQFLIRNLAIHPLKDYPLSIANEAYSMSWGWAEGSLLLTERVLTSQYGLNKPPWISDGYWLYTIVPYLINQCFSDSECKSPNSCIAASCVNQTCRWTSRYGEPCVSSDLCYYNATCSYSGMCTGPRIACSNQSESCVEGNCVPMVDPPLPICNYTNPFGPLNLYWEFIGNDSIRIAFNLPGEGFVGFGIGDDMVDSDILIGYRSRQTIVVQDYWSDLPGAPFLDSDLGGKNDITDIWATADIDFTNGLAQQTVWFTRKLDTGDPYDHVITNSTMSFIYAWGGEFSGEVVYHGDNRNIITVDLSKCN